MSEDQSSSGVEFETILSQYSKGEEKLINHHRFQGIASEFWVLLPKNESGKVTKQVYTELLHRFYIVLLPFYRKDEVEKEILNEWIYDCQGCPELDYNLFTRVLFRIAHSWSVHIDYEEYASLLKILYERVTCKVHVKAGERKQILPKIVISFPEEEKKFIQGKEDEDDKTEENDAEWVECDEDESPRSDFEYKYGDENDTMDLKRYKRPKNASGLGVMITTHIKEPFLYQES